MLKQLWKTKVRLVFVIISIILVIVLMGLSQSGVIGFRTNLLHASAGKTDITVTVKKTLPVSEMNGMTVAVEKVIDSKQDGVPIVGGKSMLIVAGWNVKLGIDASKIRIKTDEQGKTIQVALPELKINSIEQSGTPHIYSQNGSLLDRYSSQAVLNAVNSRGDVVKAAVLKDRNYRAQTYQSLESTLSAILNGTPGIKGAYKVAYTLPV